MTNPLITATNEQLAALMLPYFCDITDSNIDDYIAIALRDDDTRSMRDILADALDCDIADLLHNSNLDDLLDFDAMRHSSDDDHDAIAERILADFDTHYLADLIMLRLP